MSKQKQPQWQPISMLASLSQHIDGMLQADQEQYETLLEAKPKPHVLDDYTVNRVTRAFTTAKNDLPLFDEQLRRWGALTTLTTTQRQEVTRLKGQMKKLHEVVGNVLSLADELAKGTIEKQMGKSDVEDAAAWIAILISQVPHA